MRALAPLTASDVLVLPVSATEQNCQKYRHPYVYDSGMVTASLESRDANGQISRIADTNIYYFTYIYISYS